MSEQKVPLLSASMADDMQSGTSDHIDYRSELLAIATGDAATYNTHTHVVVPRGEIEALRKDAARYRWLRDGVRYVSNDWPIEFEINCQAGSPSSIAVELDIDIDAAIAGETP